MTKNDKDWLKFLNPDTVYYNFMLSSLYITSYDLLKNSIISQIESFYTNGFDQNGFILDKKYKTDVLNLDSNKNKLQASILWLEKNNVISEEDKIKFGKIRDQRNELAHKTLEILTDSEKEIDINLLLEIKYLLKKIDQWFILEVEIPTNPYMTKEEYESIDKNNVQSMSMIYLDYLMHTIFGKEDEKDKMFEVFKKTIMKKYGENFNKK
jgi:hypothetical protein